MLTKGLNRGIILIAAALTLSACAGRERDITLRVVQSDQSGPDEFGIIPGKPLQQPDQYTTLPAPNPGGANRTDQNPLGDGVAALGGNPARLNPAGVPRGESALVAYAGRNGVDPNVRTELAQQDEDYRRRKSVFTKFRLKRTDLYNKIYKNETLNAQREMNRYRRAGVPTPTAPPLN
ncbi:DUF3035 domain-containing protein [Rhodalgimonas zhirmunskyi]|nr:DUF3035 domain-containing protein [Rhodoalgimonas zhirmunskyi]